MLVVLASSNRGKLAELNALLAPFHFDVRSQAEYGLVTPPETGVTFAENALLKARFVAQTTGLPALADDSGLEVDALDGAPGVYSARYAGEHASDDDNITHLLAALEGVRDDTRTARYRCVIAFVRGPADASPILAEGTWEGRIARVRRGTAGFGYDPVFEIPAAGVTVAEISADAKNASSHRAQALMRFRATLAA